MKPFIAFHFIHSGSVLSIRIQIQTISLPQFTSVGMQDLNINLTEASGGQHGGGEGGLGLGQGGCPQGGIKPGQGMGPGQGGAKASILRWCSRCSRSFWTSKSSCWIVFTSCSTSISCFSYIIKLVQTSGV